MDRLSASAGAVAAIWLSLAGVANSSAESIEVSALLPGISDADCGQLSCRPGGNRVELHLDAERALSFAVPKSPYVTKDGSIIIYPGETLEFDFPNAGTDLGPPRFLRDTKNNVTSSDSAAAKAPAALTIDFEQETIGGGPYMHMNLRHTLTKTLKLDATISGFTREGLKQSHSSTCALMPKIFDDESWPGILGPVVLANARVVDNAKTSAETGVETISIGCN
jgi:hypothetical protein